MPIMGMFLFHLPHGLLCVGFVTGRCDRVKVSWFWDLKLMWVGTSCGCLPSWEMEMESLVVRRGGAMVDWVAQAMQGHRHVTELAAGGN
ncbi:hypothetical protein M758_3G033200 [Ceratodon purpureus]|nr:hypothetical protein M758_3G033200 [Ceratodon purpureus]